MRLSVADPIRIAAFCLASSMAAGLVYAQDQPAAGGWRKVGEPPRTQAAAPPPPETAEPQPAPEAPPDPNAPVPAELTIKPGTYITVRVDQPLSSDENQPGDAFSATLVKPVVVDGIVVAARGQTVGGRVVEAQKAGRARGMSRLAIQLTELTLADGTQVPIKSQLARRTAPDSTGRDAGAIAGGTALGAAIGAAADWGRGAAIGAAAGAAASTIGVLLTRGHPTVIYPESMLTFQIEAPVEVVTDRAPQAFRSVRPEDYERASREPSLRPRYRASAGCGGPYGCPAPPYWYPYYWGPGWGYFYGPGAYFGTSFYFGRGFHRGFHRW